MLTGKTILVTGGLSRLGEPLARWLEAHNARVLVTTRDDGRAHQFNGSAEKAGQKARAFVLSLDDETETRRFIRQVIERQGPIHGLVNNAYAELEFRTVGDIPWSHWAEAGRVGLAVAETLAAVLVEMRAESHVESIVNVASIYGVTAPDFSVYVGGGEPSAAYYGATKAGLIALTRYLAAYWGPLGVRVNAVSPGGIIDEQDPEFLNRYSKTVPMARMVTADEVSAAIGFLLGPESSGITGTNIVIDGGKTIW